MPTRSARSTLWKSVHDASPRAALARRRPRVHSHAAHSSSALTITRLAARATRRSAFSPALGRSRERFERTTPRTSHRCHCDRLLGLRHPPPVEFRLARRPPLLDPSAICPVRNESRFHRRVAAQTLYGTIHLSSLLVVMFGQSHFRQPQLSLSVGSSLRMPLREYLFLLLRRQTSL